MQQRQQQEDSSAAVVVGPFLPVELWIHTFSFLPQSPFCRRAVDDEDNEQQRGTGLEWSRPQQLCEIDLVHAVPLTCRTWRSLVWEYPSFWYRLDLRQLSRPRPATALSSPNGSGGAFAESNGVDIEGTRAVLAQSRFARSLRVVVFGFNSCNRHTETSTQLQRRYVRFFALLIVQFALHTVVEWRKLLLPLAETLEDLALDSMRQLTPSIIAQVRLLPSILLLLFKVLIFVFLFKSLVTSLIFQLIEPCSSLTALRVPSCGKISIDQVVSVLPQSLTTLSIDSCGLRDSTCNMLATRVPHLKTLHAQYVLLIRIRFILQETK